LNYGVAAVAAAWHVAANTVQPEVLVDIQKKQLLVV
jgi:hypothetical protein